MESIIITSKWIGYIYNGIFGILVYILCESVCLLHLRNFCDSQSKLNKILKHQLDDETAKSYSVATKINEAEVIVEYVVYRFCSPNSAFVVATMKTVR